MDDLTGRILNNRYLVEAYLGERVIAQIIGGQICPGNCYDAGSQADWCLWSNFPTTSQVLVSFPDGKILDLGINHLSENRTCINDGPMPTLEGGYVLQVKGFDGPFGTISKTLKFKVCDCPEK